MPTAPYMSLPASVGIVPEAASCLPSGAVSLKSSIRASFLSTPDNLAPQGWPPSEDRRIEARTKPTVSSAWLIFHWRALLSTILMLMRPMSPIPAIVIMTIPAVSGNLMPWPLSFISESRRPHYVPADELFPEEKMENGPEGQKGAERYCVFRAFAKRVHEHAACYGPGKRTQEQSQEDPL